MLYLFVSRLPSREIATQRERSTATALAQAREALIGYAASRTTPAGPGTLPCPDTDNDGSANDFGGGNNCTTYVGRLPWRTLGLPAPRDGHGECLWYALSPKFRYLLSPATRSASERLNYQSAGELLVYGADSTPVQVMRWDGTVGNAASDPVVAVVFSPGPALSGQDRAASGSPACGGNAVPSNYLDATAIANNADWSDLKYVAARPDGTFNDRLEWLTVAQFFRPVARRIARDIMRGPDGTGGLRAFALASGGVYPWAASPGTGTAVPDLTAGQVPFDDITYSTDASLESDAKAWLYYNDWFSLIGYAVAPDAKSATLDVGGIVFTCPADCG